METLENLESISCLSERVIRILGQNPGKFTLQGTNTYLIGKHNPYTLIDTGEGKDEYIRVLESALRDTTNIENTQEPDVSDIIISHWHNDHVGGLPSVLALLRRLWDVRNPALPFKPPRLHKFPIPTGTPTVALNTQYTIPSILESIPPDSFTPSPQGRPFHHLTHNQILSAPATSLHVLHTPGHTADSICLYISEDKALYTSDSVLGQGTAVFEDLAAYITSLQQLLDFSGSMNGTSIYNHNHILLYPGHGPVVSDGLSLIRMYIKHRMEREEQIVQVLKSPSSRTLDKGGSSQAVTTWEIVSVIYAAYPESLWLPAAHSVDLHLQKLTKENRVKRLDGEGKDARWLLIQ